MSHLGVIFTCKDLFVCLFVFGYAADTIILLNSLWGTVDHADFFFFLFFPLSINMFFEKRRTKYMEGGLILIYVPR